MWGMWVLHVSFLPWWMNWTKQITKEIFNTCLDDPLSTCEMGGIGSLSFREFVYHIDHRGKHQVDKSTRFSCPAKTPEWGHAIAAHSHCRGHRNHSWVISKCWFVSVICYLCSCCWRQAVSNGGDRAQDWILLNGWGNAVQKLHSRSLGNFLTHVMTLSLPPPSNFLTVPQ